MTASLSIGAYRFSAPVFLAPMAGYTDVVFRQLCVEHGAAGGPTELLSAVAFARRQRKTIGMLRFFAGERPRWVQLFGPRADVLVDGALVAVEHGAEIIDLNFGCPVRKVVSGGSGAAWLTRPDEAVAAVAALRAALPAVVPLTVKLRSGWDQGSIVAPMLAPRLVAAGAAALTIHGRTRSQLYSGRADWELIRAVVQAVGAAAPVIGNGDVRSAEDAAAMLALGCAGVMIGRAAIGNPWLFTAAARALAGPPPATGVAGPPALAVRVETALRHLRLMVADERGDERRACRRFRAFARGYCAGFPGAAAARRQLNGLDSVAAVERLFEVAFGQERGPQGE